MSGKHDHQRTARRAASAHNPEVQRRREMWRKACGAKKQRVSDWNVAWNLAGRPVDFPDFDAWSDLIDVQRLDAQECGVNPGTTEVYRVTERTP